MENESFNEGGDAVGLGAVRAKPRHALETAWLERLQQLPSGCARYQAVKFLDTTAGSTAATDTAVKLYMPPAEASRVLAYLDRLQALEAAQPDPAHARAARTERIEALILEALGNATLHAEVMEAPNRKRVSTVIDHLVEFGTRYRIKKPPCRETVCKILMKYGYLSSVATI
ncbi:hypothetical protein ACF8EF_01425 [Pseudomonas sp. zjy_15]|uniref:hypothetical protein n=1 Tax=Pseudomonas sp. zjy_15 TaxID=3367265 RepID=UPI00370AE94F